MRFGTRALLSPAFSLALVAPLGLAACDGPADAGPPTVADLEGAVALVQLAGDEALYRQLADDSLAPVLPEGARLLAFQTTDTHAYVQLAAPLWLQGESGGQWCALLDLPLDAGDTVAPRCLARTVDTDPDAPPAVDAVPVEVHAYDDAEVWVFWQVTHAENDTDIELWAYRDGDGAHAATLDVAETSFAVEGGFVYGGELWTLDGGTPASTPLDADLSSTRWGPYQLTDEPYELFRPSEGVVRLPDGMAGDPYCASYLSEDRAHVFSDGPNLILPIGTAWDGDYDVPPTYCGCTLDWDCQLLPEEQAEAIRALPTPWDIVDPRHPDGMAYVAWEDELYFVHDQRVSADFGAAPADRFFHWGHDLYFLEDVAESPDRYFRVDWAGEDAVITELTGFAGVDPVRIVRI